MNCVDSHKEFSLKKHKFRRRTMPRRKKISKLTYKEYSQMCRFKFTLEEYPKEFDLNLIKEYGWYNKDNPNGVSRDHMLSISYGWKRNIPPRIIKHPANCQLMLYETNRDKGWRSSLNLGKLLERIKDWNRKYK